ncbi:MAG: F0F1 ATP synthase subunit gamma, partial [Eubacterium sp.]|nr:F0F1 ATP synthase subunit gamma [Candidatus Colimonas fimequi]
MAESMQDIKRRIRSITSTEHITNAMKLVSAGK